MSNEEVLRALSSRQHGLVAKSHLPRVGLTLDDWRRARRNGQWEVISVRVLRLAGAPATPEQAAFAAVLDAGTGAMLHGPSALAWHGMAGFDLRTLHVARPRERGSGGASLSRLHRLRDIRPHDVVVHRGVPTETALRAIWSEASRFSNPLRFDVGCRRIARLLDDANVAGLVTWSGLRELVDDIHERGRAGSTIMRALAKERPPGSSPTESGNEQRFEEILGRFNRKRPRRQVTIGGLDVIGRIDYRDARLPLVVEVNSMRYHSSISDRAADEERYDRLNDAGLMVAVIWEDDLWRFDRSVVEVVDTARAMAGKATCEVVHSPSCPWLDPHGRLNLPVDIRKRLPLRG